MEIQPIVVESGLIENYVTPRKAADMKGVFHPSVYDAIRNGRLTAYRVFGQTVLLKADVEAWTVRAKNGTRTKKAPAQ